MPRPEPDAIVVLVRGETEVASWPLPGPAGPAARPRGNGERGCPDVSVVDILARLQLAARRLGCSIHLRDACPELSQLLHLAGLSEVVKVAGGGRLEVGGKPEDLEQPGVEEVVVPDDPVA